MSCEISPAEAVALYEQRPGRAHGLRLHDDGRLIPAICADCNDSAAWLCPVLRCSSCCTRLCITSA